MAHSAERHAWVYGVVGLVIGIFVGRLVGRLMVPGWRWPMGFPIGVPELFLMVGPLVFLAFWVVLIVAIVRGLGLLGRDRYRRLEDLPADFDDWHRRAHAQMMREAASADDPGRRG
jgi:hypothetical protein